MKRINWCSNICGKQYPASSDAHASQISEGEVGSSFRVQQQIMTWKWSRGHAVDIPVTAPAWLWAKIPTVHRYRQLGSDPRPNMNQALWLIWQVLCPYISSSCFCMFSSYWSALWHEATRVINLLQDQTLWSHRPGNCFLCHTLPPSCSTDHLISTERIGVVTYS